MAANDGALPASPSALRDGSGASNGGCDWQEAGGGASQQVRVSREDTPADHHLWAGYMRRQCTYIQSHCLTDSLTPAGAFGTCLRFSPPFPRRSIPSRPSPLRSSHIMILPILDAACTCPHLYQLLSVGWHQMGPQPWIWRNHTPAPMGDPKIHQIARQGNNAGSRLTAIPASARAACKRHGR